MSKFKSIQNTYSPLKKKYIPLWVLDINTLTVSHYNADTNTTEVKTYHSDRVKFHISFFASKYSDRLRKLVKQDKDFQIANESGNLLEVGKIANGYREQAKKDIYDAYVYV